MKESLDKKRAVFDQLQQDSRDAHLWMDPKEKGKKHETEQIQSSMDKNLNRFLHKRQRFILPTAKWQARTQAFKKDILEAHNGSRRRSKIQLNSWKHFSGIYAFECSCRVQ